MSERRVAAVTETVRDDRMDVTPRESRNVLAFLGRPTALPTLARRAVAAGAGALLACSFAPLNWWPLAVLCPAVLMWLWQGATPREGAWLGFWFNAGTFAAGTYWLYISIHILGEAPLWIALGLMAALVVIMGLYHAALGYFVTRWLPATGAGALVTRCARRVAAHRVVARLVSVRVLVALARVLADRHVARQLRADRRGVWHRRAVVVECGWPHGRVIAGRRARACVGGVFFVLPWLVGGRPPVSRVDPAVRSACIGRGGPGVDLPGPEMARQQSGHNSRRCTIDLTEKVLGKQLIVWPESAVPGSGEQSDALHRASCTGRPAPTARALVFGILRESDDGEHYFNSIISLDRQISWYDKRSPRALRGVLPGAGFVRDWLRLMSLPYSNFTRGGANQPPLPVAGLELGATICYEDAYGSAMLGVLRKADALVNVTNDAWFGHSTARHQHFQIARMRALEAGRYPIRAANDGITGVIGPHGEVVARAPEFQAYVLQSSVTPRTGLTPYARVGNWLIVTLATVALAYGLWMRKSYGRRPPMGTPSAGA